MARARFLQTMAFNRLQELTKVQPENMVYWQAEKAILLGKIIALSDFVYESLLYDNRLLPWLEQQSEFHLRAPFYRDKLKKQIANVRDEEHLLQVLRAFRRKEMMWLAWHDFNHSISLDNSLSHLSKLADALIMESYTWLYQQACLEWGTPCDEKGKAQPMLILAMGKLGGGELNFSSDIDLIFTYPCNGETQGGRRSISHAQFFTRLGQRLIKALDQQTVDGFCYRVDMRLRPFGDSGPLVMSFAALEDYYQEQGRDWERYAMIKARVIGKEQFACYQTLRQLLRPFVFRRYIDFSAIQSLRRMKSLIRSEVRRRGLINNIKLGAGGIREIEFIVQSFQLIRGGRFPILRKRGLLITLKAIKRSALLPLADCEVLEAAYRYFRQMENLLQAISDQQTQTLPEDETDQLRLVEAMQMTSWEHLLITTKEHMNAVHVIFDDIVGDDKEKEASPTRSDELYCEIWDAARDQALICQILSDVPFIDVQEIKNEQSDEKYCAASLALKKAQILFNFKQDIIKRTLGPRGREVLNNLMPVILNHTLSLADQGLTFERVLQLLTRIATRTTYLELLDENHSAIVQLVKLCHASPMVAAQLAEYPILLDELLDLQQLYHPIPFTQYRTDLAQFVARVAQEDMEQQMEMIRQFKQTQLLRIAAADIANILPVMKVSDHLTYLAEAIMEGVVEQAWHQMITKYGKPCYLNGQEGRGFAVVGYGKIGGIELGYGSDLDVVFLHNCPENEITDGAKEIDGRLFYLKLAQRIVHLFSTRTSSGVLYEIDTRLRPSGSSGMMVTTILSFAQYQEHDAWTWEHQALVRARIIYGTALLANEFSNIRQSILTRPRKRDELQKQVREMRLKMRQHQHSDSKGRFDIKHGIGGITDIEFLAQYLVLAYSHDNPSLTQFSDNVRILESMAQAGILCSELAFTLRDAYTTMRDEIHRLNLLGVPPLVSDQQFCPERKVVQQAWTMWLETN